MAGKKETSREARYTWSKGEAVITDRNGKPIDLSKLDAPKKTAAKKPAGKKK